MNASSCLLACALAGSVLLAGGSVTPARAQADPGSALTIGSSLGVGFLFSEGSNTLTVISVPHSGGLVGVAPGFRIGQVSAGRGFEFGVDASVVYLNSDGSSAHDLLIGLDAAGFVIREGDTHPYFGGEVGLRSLDLFAEGSQPYLGFGGGVRHVVAGDHGAIKFDLKYRRFFENKSDRVGAFNAFHVGMAFDLWIP